MDATQAAIAAIEARLEANQDAGAIAADIEAAEAAIPSGMAYPHRLAVAKAVVQNRLGLPRDALALLMEARGRALAAGDPGALAPISRTLGLVHGWRGDARSAALELLQSFAEAEAAGDAAEAVKAIAEAGRLNLEVARYRAAAELFDYALARAGAALSARDRARVAVNLCQALNAAEEPERAAAAVAAARAAIPSGSPRLELLVAIEEARAHFALGRRAEALAMLEAVRALLPEDEDRFEWTEYRLLAGRLMLDERPAEARGHLEPAVQRLAADDLAGREVEARLLLGRALARLGERPAAQACLARALQRAVARQLAAPADRVRGEMVALGLADNLLDLGRGAGEAEQRFLVRYKLGEGGFGSVSRAVDLDNGADVAIKRIPLGATYDRVRAAQLAASLRSELAAGAAATPGVARVLYLSIDPEGDAYVVQEFVDGPTFRRIIDRREPAPRLLTLLGQSAQALGGLHRRGIAHCDIKPDNIILRDGSQPVLIDLGLAVAAGLTGVRGLGTAGYAAPEIAAGTVEPTPDAMRRVDAFAFGRMIEEALTGIRPDIAEKEKAAPAPSFLGGLLSRKAAAPALPKPVAELVAAMTAADPAARAADLDAAARVLLAAAAAYQR